ncbi:MAG TPA: DUF3857 and transglutaminase domain-containing protein [Steroidobacteraceae bacterium]|nr:DUF3857 and transglutaminase domain-containing protein [Steroidobacteraceae bacterium]
MSQPLPAHDDKADAVVLWREETLTVGANGKIKRLRREVVKILRPDGADWAKPRFYYDPNRPISGLRGWSIPPDGKDFEVKERDAVDSVDSDVEGGELVSDLRMKVLVIPGALPGAVIGYEVEQELRPEILAEDWNVQYGVPVRASRFSLVLPSGWSYESAWLNHAVETPASTGPNQWTWSLNDVPAVKVERYMPPWQRVAAHLVVSLIPPGKNSSIRSWNDVGIWYAHLIQDRRTASPAIKQKVAELTANLPDTLAKMRALARFVQTDIRYVAIELGIGGHQPHPAAEIFAHRYGDCKDNVTLLSTMLKEIGVDSYYVIINTDRGAVTMNTPPSLNFDHAVMAIALPAGVDAASLPAQIVHPKLGKLLFFDPTDSLTPFGALPGELQANVGLLVTGNSGELVQLPQLPPELSGLTRTAKMQLDEKGTLHGDIHEVHLGGHGARQRAMLRSAQLDTDRVRPIERLAQASLSNFQVLKASISNLHAEERPFEWNYTLEVSNYAKPAGDLMLVRPRILGSEADGFLESKSARVHAIEFAEPERDTDVVEIAVPAGYGVDELPPQLSIDDGFASYHSKSEYSGGTLRYTRTLEIRELSVPAEKADLLKQFYREIAADERNFAVLKRRPAP